MDTLLLFCHICYGHSKQGRQYRFKNSIHTLKVKFDIKTQDVYHKKVYITHSSPVICKGFIPAVEFQSFFTFKHIKSQKLTKLMHSISQKEYV